MYDLQHGFREKRSCDQAHHAYRGPCKECQFGKTDGHHLLFYCMLDVSKAFDKVNHCKLLRKLHQYDIRGQVLSLVRAFLGSRSQRVVIDGEESESAPVTSGVPQGSVLGHILFPIYLNDLPDEVCSQVRLSADDTSLYLTIESKDDSSALQNDLELLSKWETRWDMEFNPSKCQVVHVTGSKIPIKRLCTARAGIGVCLLYKISWG